MRHYLMKFIPSALLAANLVFSLQSDSFAQTATWPSKAVKIVVPSAAGSAPDIMTRILATELQKRLGQPFVAENKPGAGGSLGSDIVAKAAPDGYSLVMGNIGSHAMNVGVYPKLPYHPVKDFDAVTMVATTPSLLTISSELPIKSVKDFIDYARKEGEKITFSSGGNGSSSHLAGEYLNLLAGLKMRHVPYKDVPQALGDVAAQRVTMMMSNMPPAMALVRAGKLRPLAVTTKARSKTLPDVPSISEGGLAFEQTVWFALFAPAGTPAAVLERLNREVGEILKDPAVIEKIAATGATAASSTAPELKNFVVAEVDKWNKVAKESGAKAD
jgi:tripartite-type tricarboxylate transporter receptor subunit TctC